MLIGLKNQNTVPNTYSKILGSKYNYLDTYDNVTDGQTEILHKYRASVGLLLWRTISTD